MGYTGADTPDPTYKSVCQGDGHTEALRLEYDPRIITFEELITRYFEDPHVRNVYPGDNQKPQYMSAIWAQDQEQSTIAKRVSDEVGKSVPVLERKDWYDAEDWHQHFLTDFKDFPEDDDDVEYAAF